MTALTPAEKQARSRKARALAGGKAVHVILSPAATAKLSQWLGHGLNATETVNRLLERSKPHPASPAGPSPHR